MKKSMMLLLLVTTWVFCYGQNGTDSVRAQHVIPPETKGLTKAGLAKAIEDGTIYNSTSPYHNVSHEFTYQVAMRDYCNKTLSHMRDSGEMDKKLLKKLKQELSKAKSELASAKYKGLKIESDYYELFSKKIEDQFRN